MEAPLSVDGAWRFSFHVEWRPFFPGVLCEPSLECHADAILFKEFHQEF